VVFVEIGVARPVEQVACHDDIEGEAVRRRNLADLAGWDLGETRQLRHYPQVGIGMEHRAIARQQHTHVADAPKCARQTGRDFAEAAHFEEIRDF
jgi:hypothetical protein